MEKGGIDFWERKQRKFKGRAVREAEGGKLAVKRGWPLFSRGREEGAIFFCVCEEPKIKPRVM